MKALVSVLMPVAAPAPFLAEAIESITCQTTRDWELVLVVDGVNAEISATARRLVPARRLKLVELSTRRGIAPALNAGLAVANGEYVARLDSDDRSCPERLERQLHYLQSNPAVALVGSSARLIDAEGGTVGFRTVRAGDAVNSRLMWRNQFVHSSVMFRRGLVTQLGGYSELVELREDYELWLRIAAVADVANIAESLVDYRLGSSQISRGRVKRDAVTSVNRARRDLGSALGWPPGPALAASVAWAASQHPIVGRVLSFSRVLRSRLKNENGDAHGS